MNEKILQDRLDKIREVINKYGEENFYVSFSGGKDSTVLSVLVDMALPGNNIPRVFADTGIEYNLIREFVYRKASNDTRFHIIKPRLSIIDTLKKVGYPFKSKKHSEFVSIYQKHKTLDNRPGLQHYLHVSDDGVSWSNQHSCPLKLRYQFTEEFTENGIKISDVCCDKLKKEPLLEWQKENKKPYSIIGVMASEGGRRMSAKCTAFKGGKFKALQPLAPLTKEWEDWFIEKYNVEICDIYKTPYNFLRTGCKGCPFAIELQEELDTMEKYFPAERKQCEIIWKPVYDEYRRIGYRLK